MMNLVSLGCKTDEGKPCVFPFEHHGSTYTSCAAEGTTGKYWCATEVDSNRDYNDNWDYCGSTCNIGN